MRRGHHTMLVAVAAALVGISRYALRARVPDDYDSIGFVLALDHFDMARFQPHFPGYPVYVALGRAAHAFIASPLAAATAVSATAAAATAAGLWWIASRLYSAPAAWLVLGLYAASALPWIMGGTALSDGTATALSVLGFAALLEERGLAKGALVGGLLIGLMLGTRASYFPIALSWLAVLFLLVRQGQKRSGLWLGFIGLLLGTAVWAVPFVLVVGARRLAEMGRVHLVGHFSEWGGTIVTQPNLGTRWTALLRALFYDGLAPHGFALALLAIAIAIAIVAIVASPFLGFQRPGPSPRALMRSLCIALVVAVPYALWVYFGQNIIEQPRHVLPLMGLLLIGMAGLLEKNPALAVAAIVVMTAASLPLAIEHNRTKPAAAQLAAYAAAHYRPDEVAVFGGRSIRFVQSMTALRGAFPRQWLSEVDVTLERLDKLPGHVLVTSEVESDPVRKAHLKSGPTFCRDARLDHALSCLRLDEYFILEGRAP